MKFNLHQSVLLQDVLENLALKDDGIYFDATFGRGGHSRAILTNLGPGGNLFAIDRDPAAAAYANEFAKTDSRFTFAPACFDKLVEIAQQFNILGKVNGLLLDIGVSSPQLDDPSRGFSFLRDGPLDMRMDPEQGCSVAKWINRVAREELVKVLWEYGEERFAKQIADAIIKERQQKPILTTLQLATLIADTVPSREPGKHPATRSFQALRIFINDELQQLQNTLQQSLQVLAIGGRLLVISFHSLEDRIVKRFMRQHAKGDYLPSKLPVTQDYMKPKLKIIGKAINPSMEEITNNPRARSAVLRVAEKLA